MTKNFMAKSLMIGAMLCLVGGAVKAEPMRTRLTKDNRFPDLGKVELSLDVHYEERDVLLVGDFDFGFAQAVDRYEVAPEVRYQAFPNVSLLARIPFVSVDPEMGGSNSGLGDISLGFEWLAYEHIFTYPYLIPYATLHLGTGDEKKALGRGETGLTLGATLGSRRWDVVVFSLDGAYTIFDDSDDVASLAGSVIWEIRRELSVHVEGVITDEDFGPDESTPYLILGGISYRPYHGIHWTLYGGGGDNGQPDATVGLRATLGF